jgi:hypothetical protein
MPLDANPEQRVILGAATGRARVVNTYTSHFATCPHANEHRKPKP